jgi:hypothetical protein
LHADFSSRVWEAEGCAPLVVTGETVDRVRQRLNAMARPAQRADSDPQVAAA